MVIHKMASQRRHPKFEYLTSRWGGMQLRIELGDRIEKWLTHFSEEEQKLLLELLSKFYYYSEEKIKVKTKELYDKFVFEHNDIAEQVVYSKVFKEYGASYSDILFTSFWLNNNLSDQSEPNLYQLIKDGSVPSKVAIVDDYSGTGKTLIKTLDKLIQANANAANATYYFLALHITNRALLQIKEYSDNTGVRIEVVFLEKSEETFKHGYLYEEVDAIAKKHTYEAMCNKLAVNKDFILGFEEVESLVAFHYNTPNNTLGLFWQDLSDFVALFPRHKRQKTSLRNLQQDAKRRKQQSIHTVVYGIDDGRLAVAMAYCVAHTKGFSVKSLEEDLGLTTRQADELLREMLREDYVTNNSGIISATAKLKSQMFTSRLKTFKKSFKDDYEENLTTFDSHSEYIPINFK